MDPTRPTSWQEKRLAGLFAEVVGDDPALLELCWSSDPQRVSGMVAEFLDFACKAQGSPAILAGRTAFGWLPPDWVSRHVGAVIAQAIDLSDAWEYRRLLELLDQAAPQLLDAYVTIGLGSADPEVKEAAEDWREGKEKERTDGR